MLTLEHTKMRKRRVEQAKHAGKDTLIDLCAHAYTHAHALRDIILHGTCAGRKEGADDHITLHPSAQKVHNWWIYRILH